MDALRTFSRREVLAAGACGVAFLRMPAWSLMRPDEPSPATHDPLDAELLAVLNDPAQPLASLAAVAVRGGAIVHETYLGRRYINPDDSSRDRPVTADTLFRVASISKLIVSIGVMRLVEQDKLSLDADVGNFLGFKLRNPHFADKPLTLRMMMSHTSSLRDGAGYYFSDPPGLSLADVLLPGGKAHGAGKMWASDHPPGAYFQYANLPWGVIGTIMERAAGERFDRLMQRLVIEPLGMVGGFLPAAFVPDSLSNVATLYRKRSGTEGKEVWNPAGPWLPQTDDFVTAKPVSRAPDDYVPGTNGTFFGPQGNCRTTARGLFRVMTMLANEGTIDGTRLLAADSVRAMLSTQWTFDGTDGNNGGEYDDNRTGVMNRWGLGVQHFTDLHTVEKAGPHAGPHAGRPAGDRLVEPGGFTARGHLGEAYGLTAALAFDPKTRDGLIFLVGGIGTDPYGVPSRYSSFFRYEERIMTALYERAIVKE